MENIFKKPSQYLATYGSTPLVSAFSTINWKYINQYTFKNISALSSYLIFIIQLISILLSILFAIIVSSLFIDSNKKKIATLWTLGYRRTEIIKIFLRTYILPMAITIVFSLIISFSIVSILRLLIMNFAYILIPFSIAWWMPLSSSRDYWTYICSINNNSNFFNERKCSIRGI